MKWLITGGTGQLGLSLGKLLKLRGSAVISLGHKELNVADYGSQEALVSMKPDIIVNCAAWTDVNQAEFNFEEARRTNENGAINVAKAANVLDIPLIHISTDYVFSGRGKRPWKVGDERNPTTKYGLSKALGENGILENHKDKSVILRTAWLYGPHGENFAKKMVRNAIRDSRTIKVVNDQIGQPTSTEDLASQILKVVESEITGCILHATNAGEASWYEFACEIFKLCKEPASRVEPIESAEFRSLVERPAYSVLDHSDWRKFSLPPMRPWETALIKVLPKVITEVKKEMACG